MNRNCYYYPATFEQERVWILNHHSLGKIPYNIAAGFILKGKLNFPLMEETIYRLAMRHETLRTTFVENNGKLLQKVIQAPRIDITYSSIFEIAESQWKDEARKRVFQESLHRFDLEKGPLFRVGFFRVGEESHMFLLTFHHIISDARSIIIFVREMMALYELALDHRVANLHNLELQYGQFAVLQRQHFENSNLPEDYDYWQGVLRKLPPRLRFPGKKACKQDEAISCTTHFFSISSESLQSLHEFCFKEKVTPFISLLTALKLLLYCHSGQENIVVGVPVSGRLDPRTTQMIGFFAYPVIVQTDLVGDPFIGEVLQRVRKAAQDVFSHQSTPLAKILPVEYSYNHLFQVLCSLLFASSRTTEIKTSCLSASLLAVSGGIDFDLYLALYEMNRQLEGIIVYNPNMYSEIDIKSLSCGFKHLLDVMRSSPNTRLSRIPGLI